MELLTQGIYLFQGDNRFLSNFWQLQTPIRTGGLTYWTVEHYYQAMKTIDPVERKKISEADRAVQAKKYGKKVTLRTDWNEIKDDVMKNAVRFKFCPYRNPSLYMKLEATGDLPLLEGNQHNDKYWGFCLKTHCGENKLGKILMEIREENRHERLSN